jgi:hypothetical protein
MKTQSFPLAAGLVLALAAAQVSAGGGRVGQQAEAALLDLVPQIEGWDLDGEVQAYLPESLFEYINGAAESYLSYDFRELLVAQFAKQGSEATMTLEIYDMETPLNAFGIFSAERYPENSPVSVGEAGYLDSEALNFLRGKHYVKLLGFGLEADTPTVLETFARGVSDRAKGAGGLPGIFRAMPTRGLIPRSEKFIKKNFLGYEFLSDGYVASYDVDGREIECFVVETGSDEDAETMEGRLLEALTGDEQVPEKIASGTHVRNRYSQHLFLGRSGRFLFGVVRVPDGLEGAGERYLKELRESLSRKGGGS